MLARTATAKFPAKLQCLFTPNRYKILYGGRGGAKSWGAARALLIQGAAKPLRVLCAREIQRSIKDSVHKLLSDQVTELGLTAHYEVLQDEIRGKNGTEFTFSGLRHNVDSIKSKEGVDIVWVEEANLVSASSWEKLIPTIRKEGSEIWITFNPELETDETYQRFVLNPPEGATVVKLTHADNPWFPDVLRKEMAALQARDPDAYLTVWEGNCRQTLEGAIYAREIREATAAGRITSVPHTPGHQVLTFWDLGKRDLTAIWFVQQIGYEFRFIDYYENCAQMVPHFLKEMQSKAYVYGTVWLPHDAEADQQAAEKTIQAQIEASGFSTQIVPNIGVANGINSARSLFPRCVFDERNCADGLHALRHYQYKVDALTGQRSAEPLHNWASNGADAFRYHAVAITEPETKRVERRRRGGGSWMAA